MKLLHSMTERTRNRFNDWDLALLKTYGAIPGLVVGAYFPEFIKKYLLALIIAFSIPFIRYVYLLFIKSDELVSDNI